MTGKVLLGKARFEATIQREVIAHNGSSIYSLVLRPMDSGDNFTGTESVITRLPRMDYAPGESAQLQDVVVVDIPLALVASEVHG